MRLCAWGSGLFDEGVAFSTPFLMKGCHFCNFDTDFLLEGSHFLRHFMLRGAIFGAPKCSPKLAVRHPDTHFDLHFCTRVCISVAIFDEGLPFLPFRHRLSAEGYAFVTLFRAKGCDFQPPKCSPKLAARQSDTHFLHEGSHFRRTF